MKRILLLIAIIGLGLKSEAQININNYEYVVIPLQYEFLKGKDAYRLNTLTRVLFKQEGFKAFFTEEQLPKDLFEDRCLALYPDVKKVGGGPFKKKVQIIIKDCKGNVVLESDIGDSKENNHQKAYNEALRKAFKSVERLNYTYKPEIKEENSTIVAEVVEEKEKASVIVEEKKPVKIVETKEEIKEESTQVIKEESSKDIVQEELHKERYPLMSISQSHIPVVYKAKKVGKGYEIYASISSTYQFTMYSTIINGVYIFQNEKISGNVIKRENGNWIMESIKEGKYSVEKIKLIFQ